MTQSKKRTSINIKKREGFRKAVSDLLTRLNELSSLDERPKIELSSILKKLGHFCNLIEDLNKDIEGSLSDDDIDSELAECQKVFETIWEGQSLAQSLIDQASAMAADDLKSEAGSSSVSRSVRVKLPKLELSEFDGDPLHWQEFYDSFDSTIHSNDEISVIDKFKYLKMYLKGSALRVVDGFRLTTVNYEEALAQLKERFGEPEAVKFAHFDSLLSLPVASVDTRSLEETYDQSEKHIRSLVALGLSEEQFGQVFAPILLSKLPRAVRVELHRKNGSDTWTLSNLRKLLAEEIQARKKGDWSMAHQDPAKTANKGQKGADKTPTAPRPPVVTTGALVQNAKGPPKCNFCKGEHFPDECKQFDTQAARKEAIKGNCFRCLGKGHMIQKCPRSQKKCYHCGGTSHHRSLCNTLFKEKGSTAAKTKDGGNVNALNPAAQTFIPKPDVIVVSGSSGTGLVQMQMATVQFQPGKIPARVFLDTGSSRSYVTTRLCRKLRLKSIGKEQLINTRFEEKKPRVRSYDKVSLQIPTKDGPGHVEVTALVTDTITGVVQKQAVNTDRHPMLLRLPMADIISGTPEQVFIDILIGSDFYYQIVGKERIDLDDGLILLDSKLGYITTGVLPDRNHDQSTALFVSSILNQTQSWVGHDVCHVEKFWNLEEIGIKDDGSQKDDEVAVKFFNDSIHQVDGRYEVGWPWKQPKAEMPLPDNFGIAKARLRSVQQMVLAKPELLTTYNDTIQCQLENGIIEVVPETPDGGLVHYLPHHCVAKPQRETTKVRVVYDASAKKSKFDPSLNECLLRGPVFLQQLPALLLRFRLQTVGIIADIERAFHQVGLIPSDRDVTRFLWLKDTQKPVTADNMVHYRFCRIPFGVISSPFLLDATIKHHLGQQPGVEAKYLSENMYVDNFVGGQANSAQALEFFKQAKSLLSDISMNIREWYSNDATFMASIPEQARGKGTGQATKVLGMSWNLTSDQLAFFDPRLADITVQTKRNLVQASARVFDPCGFITPALVSAKLLVQATWHQKIAWNGKLTQDMIDSWEQIAADFTNLQGLSIPRCPSTSKDVELHCFCDASGKAYAAAIYMKPLNGAESPFLIFSKSKLTPLKPKVLTIPRLELMAVIVGARILKFVTDSLKIDIKQTFLWSDSVCVLSWLKSPKVQTVFVQNRLDEIRSHSHINFRYVPSEANPADIPSRGMPLAELKDCGLWWKGPSFLKQPMATWPQIPGNFESVEVDYGPDEPSMANVTEQLNSPFDIDVSKYSDLQHLLRVTVVCKKAADRFLRAKKGVTKPQFPLVTVQDLDNATKIWIKWAQQFISTQVRQQFAAFEDSDGVLRCGGRLKHADLPENTKNPVLLPSKHPFTKLVIKQVHDKNFHAGVNHTLAAVRTNYWVPHGKSMTKSVINRCTVCRLTEGGPYRAPEFPPLPDFRVTKSPPFTFTGIDYLGPLFVKEPSGQADVSKTWICLFTCAATRAVHLEVVPDMSTKSFLLALRRFASFYGAPKLIISDNAKQFKAGQTSIRRVMAEIQNSATVSNISTDHGIDWKFIPELSPWMGGFYERLVGTVKRALKKALLRRIVDQDQLRTVAYEISYIVNSRPLVLAGEPHEQSLTPNSLLGRHERCMPGIPADTDSFSPETPRAADDIVNSWRQNCKILNNFWHTWQTSYLTSLRDYQTTFKNRGSVNANPTVGDVVLIREENVPRTRWKFGVIQALTVSADGRVRSAVLRLSNGHSLTRPIRFLYPIEVSAQPPDLGTESSQGRASASDDQPDLDTEPSVSCRPKRMAARNAAVINRLVTADQDEELDNDSALITNSLCLVHSPSSVFFLQDTENMAKQAITLRLRKGDTLGTVWTGELDPEKPPNGPVFQMDGRQMTSFDMAYWYLMLKVNGINGLAKQLAEHESLLKQALGIGPWVRSTLFNLPATWVFHADHVYFAVMVLLMAEGDNEFATKINEIIEKYPDQEVNFVLHCGNNDYVMSCGFRIDSSIEQEYDATMGYNVWGYLLTKLVYEAKKGEYNCFFTVQDLLNNDFTLTKRPPLTLLIISDSQCSQLERLQSSVSPIRISGGKYHDGARELRQRNLDPRQFCYIVLHFGINLAKVHDEDAWNRSWTPLEYELQSVLVPESDTIVIVDSPIFHPSVTYVQEHAQWLKIKVDQFPSVTFIDLTSLDDNVFVNQNGSIKRGLFRKDKFHLNHIGFRALWNQWGQLFPELLLVNYKLEKKPYEEMAPIAQNKKVNYDDDPIPGPGCSSWGV